MTQSAYGCDRRSLPNTTLVARGLLVLALVVLADVAVGAQALVAVSPADPMNRVAGGGYSPLPDIWVKPNQTTTIYLHVCMGRPDEDDGSYRPESAGTYRGGGGVYCIPDLAVSMIGGGSIAQAGGHDVRHGPFPTGTWSSSSRTGPKGEPAEFRFTAGPASGFMWPNFLIWYENTPYVIPASNGILIGEVKDDYPYLGSGSSWELIGWTARHPVNHYATERFIGQLRRLADDFIEHFGWPMPVNDMSLRKGGVFDLNGNYAPSHQTHRVGLSADIRGNQASNAIPDTPEAHQWFEERVQYRFCGRALFERFSRNPDNNHFHIFGEEVESCEFR
jgi:hypothetical protein